METGLIIVGCWIVGTFFFAMGLMAVMKRGKEMSKYDIHYRSESMYEEDNRPLPLWQTIALWIFAMCVFLFWMRP